MIGILTALLSGALMSVQGVFNTQVTKFPCTDIPILSNIVQKYNRYFSNMTTPMIAIAIPATFRMVSGCFSTPNHPRSSIT